MANLICFNPRCMLPLSPDPGNHKVRIKRNSPFLRDLLEQTQLQFVDGTYLCKSCHTRISSKRLRPALGRIRSEPGSTIDVYKRARSQVCCVVCNRAGAGKCNVPHEAVGKCFLKYRIVIALNSRTCTRHLSGLFFCVEDIPELRSNCEQIKLTDETFDFYMNQADSVYENSRNSELWFEPSSSKRSPAKCKLRFGIDDIQFDNLFERTNGFITGKTQLAKRRNLAIFLIKLRSNASLRAIGLEFGLHFSHISKIIGAVGSRLAADYAPQFIGFTHITHADFKANHSTKIADTLLQVGANDVAVYVDATYLYCEKSSNFDLQKKTFNPHKETNLVKPTTFCASDGYFLAMSSVFASDGSNNDASILSTLLKDEFGLTYFADSNGVILVLDRGYRDVIAECEELGYQTRMPKYLRKDQKQHTTEEANLSRLVTKNRWIVEPAHGRIKNVFRFFNGKCCNKFMPKYNMFLQVVCAMSNNFFGPISTNKPGDEELAAEMLSKVNTENQILNLVTEKRLLNKRIHGTPIHALNLVEFPKLSNEDIQRITYGTYQLRLAPSYLQKNVLPGGGYRINGNVDEPFLLRVEIKSRFKSGKIYKLWIRYRPHCDGYQGINGYYCTCRMGARTVGTCSHVASVLWYMGVATHLLNIPKPAAHLRDCLLQADKPNSRDDDDANDDDEDDTLNADEDDTLNADEDDTLNADEDDNPALNEEDENRDEGVVAIANQRTTICIEEDELLQYETDDDM